MSKKPIIKSTDALNDEEAEAQINQLKAQIYSLLAQLPDSNQVDNTVERNFVNEMEYEINRMSIFLQDLSQRSGVIMTVASLVSLVPWAIIDNQLIFFKYYVIWILPFLIIAIFFYTMSSLHSHIYRIKFNNTTREKEDLNLKIWKVMRNNYQTSLMWYKMSNISTQLFLFNYFLNFYSFELYGSINDEHAFIMTFGYIVTGILIYFFQSLYASKETNPHLELATGVGPSSI
ncbi:MAG TPA: hypothetical protein PLA19_04505 [Candidatus Pacearchaeota archaeon]|nr:hypothetical protein [Candidatus Pacearchaeota archaeon]